MVGLINKNSTKIRVLIPHEKISSDYTTPDESKINYLKKTLCQTVFNYRYGWKLYLQI